MVYNRLMVRVHKWAENLHKWLEDCLTCVKRFPPLYYILEFFVVHMLQRNDAGLLRKSQPFLLYVITESSFRIILPKAEVK